MASWLPNNNRVRVLQFVVIVTACQLLIGCKTRPVLGKVAGRITFQGEPVSPAVVLFSDKEKGRHITSTVDAAGNYVVQMDKGFGLPPGTYQISVTPPPLVAPVPTTGPILVPPKPPAYPNIPKKYRNVESSGLVLTVSEGENRFDVDMKP